MGFFDFGNSKPRVTKDEFKKKVRNTLYSKGFTEKELNQLEGFLGGDMQESLQREQGIDASEIDRAISWLRANPKLHTFSPEQINEIDAELRKYL